jgi:hypothetical protein
VALTSECEFSRIELLKLSIESSSKFSFIEWLVAMVVWCFSWRYYLSVFRLYKLEISINFDLEKTKSDLDSIFINNSIDISTTGALSPAETIVEVFFLITPFF